MLVFGQVIMFLRYLSIDLTLYPVVPLNRLSTAALAVSIDVKHGILFSSADLRISKPSCK